MKLLQPPSQDSRPVLSPWPCRSIPIPRERAGIGLLVPLQLAREYSPATFPLGLSLRLMAWSPGTSPGPRQRDHRTPPVRALPGHARRTLDCRDLGAGPPPIADRAAWPA